MAQIKKLADRKYLIRASKGTGSGRTFDNKVFRGTLKDARTEARKMETALDSGFMPQSRLTFDEYFKLWIKAVTPKLAPRTVDGYEGYIKRYALKSLKRFRLSDIKPHHIQRIYLETDKSPGTVRQLHASLNACFSWAVKREYIHRNPCKNADLPRMSKRPMIVLTEREAALLITTARTMRNGIIFEFALETGMRPEEYLGLRWSDVEGSEISIQQVVQYNRSGGGYYFDKPKTAKGRRRLSITAGLERLLKRHRIEQLGHRMKMKGTWFDHDLVFPNEIGRPFAINNLTRRYFAPILDKCGLGKHITLYSLRHSCATLLLMQGTNPKIVADRLGHSSVVMTLDTYSHVLPHIQDEATKTLDKVIRKARGL